MFIPVAQPVSRLAHIIIHKIDDGLDPQDVAVLKIDGPKYLRHMSTNIKMKKDPISDLNDTGKKVLLAYVIFLRQNVTMEPGDKPNEEDAARILHGDIFGSNKDDEEELEEELLKQLSKIGMDVERDEKKNKKGR
jgi:hypothetical protein